MTQQTLAGEPLQAPWDDPETLRRLYHDDGLTLREIGEELGCDATTVHRRMVDAGIDRRPCGGAPESTTYVSVQTREDGYEYWNSGRGSVLVHRLLAVSEFEYEAVASGVVHHKNRIPWDNRPENIDAIGSHREHSKLHRRMQRESDQDRKLTDGYP